MSHRYLAWVWVISATVCATASVLGAIQAWGDWRAVRQQRGGAALRIVAWGSLRREIIALIQQIVYLAAGGIALTYPPPAAVSPAQQLIRIAFLHMSFLLTWGSVRDRLERRRIIASYLATKGLAR